MVPYEIAELIDENLEFGQSGLLLENLASKLPAMISMVMNSRKKYPTGIDSSKAEELVKRLSTVDPTVDTKAVYIDYIINQYLRNNFKWEDADRLKAALTTHFNERSVWTDIGGFRDINRYRSWKELEDFVEKTRDSAGAKKSEVTSQTGVETVLELYGKPLKSVYKVVKLSTPEAVCKYGQGSRWCTTSLSPQGMDTSFKDLPLLKIGDREGYPATAAQYLQGGPMYMAFKDNKLWWQATHNFHQFMNTADTPLGTCSPATDYVLAKLQKILPSESSKGVNRIRSRCADYRGRPPLYEPEETQTVTLEPEQEIVQQHVQVHEDTPIAPAPVRPKPSVKPGTPSMPKPQKPDPFRPVKPLVVPKPKAAPVTMPAPKVKPSRPITTPGKPQKPDPFRPVKPLVVPKPKATFDQVLSSVLEAYEDEVHQGTQDFWRNLPRNKQHVFGKHHLLAMHGDKLAKDSFAHTASKMQNLGNVDFQRVFMEIMRIESQHKDELVEVAKDITVKVWGIDREMLDADITNDMSATEGESQESEIEPDYPITPELRRQINKRITMNTLTQGSAVHMMATVHHMVREAINGVSPRLLQLYDKIATASTHQYWLINMTAMLQNLANMKAGQESVKFDEENNPKVIARAVVFPVLVQELSKGVMELLTMHHISGLDEPTAKAVIHHADRLEDEPWLIQIGPELWRRFLKVVPKGIKLSDLISTLSVQDPDVVSDIVVSVVENPEDAGMKLADLIKSGEWEDEPEGLVYDDTETVS